MESTTGLQGIIFDLDGTLANTLPVCLTAFREVFIKYLNRNLTDGEIASYFGVSEEGILQQVVPLKWQDGLEMYLDEYAKAHKICARPFEGIELILNYCQANDIALAIVTGKGNRSAEISLEYLNLNGYFDIVETGSAQGGIKPLGIGRILDRWNLAADRVAYVGDSGSDIVDAKEAGVIPLAAGWAETTNVEQLRSMHPQETFITVQQFEEWIIN